MIWAVSLLTLNLSTQSLSAFIPFFMVVLSKKSHTSLWAMQMICQCKCSVTLGRKHKTQVFGVSLRLVKLWASLAHGVLYHLWDTSTLYLNRFRGKPAISEFDWPFTPSHSSSPSFATDVSSVLQCALLHLQPGHG
jgi:hypothetical protein